MRCAMRDDAHAIRTASGLGYFFCGVLICKWLPTINTWLKNKMNTKIRTWGFAFVTLVLLCAVHIFTQWSPFAKRGQTLTITTLCLAPLMILCAALVPDEELHPVIVKICTFASQISFSLYLWHQPILHYLQYAHPVFQTEYWPGLVVFSPILGLSWVSYTFFEAPLQKVLRKKLLSTKKEQDPPARTPDTPLLPPLIVDNNNNAGFDLPTPTQTPTSTPPGSPLDDHVVLPVTC